jgi:hypothetical protein
MIAYTCDQCGKTDSTMAGWYLVRIALLYEDPNIPYPPGGTTTEETKPDHIFDTKGCRAQWLSAKGLAGAVT